MPPPIYEDKGSRFKGVPTLRIRVDLCCFKNVSVHPNKVNLHLESTSGYYTAKPKKF